MLADFDRAGFIRDLDTEAKRIYFGGVDMQWLESYPNLKEKCQPKRAVKNLSINYESAVFHDNCHNKRHCKKR